MNFQEYLHYFEAVLTHDTPVSPYDNPDYFNYAKLNWARMNRWLKTAELTEEMKQVAKNVQEPQQWLIITEPWCGDAAHVVPFLHLVAIQNPLISVRYELRDIEPFSISHYLTNGGKSIPKLVIRNEAGEDLAVWGPRPVKCQKIYAELTAQKADFETVKTALQNWYNSDKGSEIQTELMALLK